MSAEASKYYVLSMLSNFNSNYAAENEAELETNIKRIHTCLQEPDVRNFLGDWKVVWGPFIANDSKNIWGTMRFWTDHAVYLAFNEKENTYFVGIAGTNGLSEKNWIQEDLNVEEMVDWLPISGNGPMVAAGAMEGFQDLWTATVDGKTILSFLNDNINLNDDTTIVVAGHSLGGCLTPLLASALAMEFTDTKVKVEAYPTAGPTPGNQAFADHLQLALHKYHAIYNANDAVPLAWDFKKLDELRENYDQWPFIKEKINTKEVLVDRWLQWAQGRAGENQYVREPSEVSKNFQIVTWGNSGVIEPQQALQQGIHDLTTLFLNSYIFKIRWKLISIHDFHSDKEKDVKAYIKNFARFFLQMGLQHVGVYSGEESPISVPIDVKKQLKVYFDHGVVDLATKSWIGTRLDFILCKVADMVLAWLNSDVHGEHEAVPAGIDEQPALSLEYRIQEIKGIADVGEREKAAAEFIEENGLDYTSLTAAWSPFGFEGGNS